MLEDRRRQSGSAPLLVPSPVEVEPASSVVSPAVAGPGAIELEAGTSSGAVVVATGSGGASNEVKPATAPTAASARRVTSA